MSEETNHSGAQARFERHAPDGRLHLGNYMGALKNWVKLQNETLRGRQPEV